MNLDSPPRNENRTRVVNLIQLNSIFIKDSGNGWLDLTELTIVYRDVEPPATRAVVLTSLPLKVVIRNAIRTGIRAASYIASQQLTMGFFQKTITSHCVGLRLCRLRSRRLSGDLSVTDKSTAETPRTQRGAELILQIWAIVGCACFPRVEHTP